MTSWREPIEIIFNVIGSPQTWILNHVSFMKPIKRVYKRKHSINAHSSIHFNDGRCTLSVPQKGKRTGDISLW